MAKNKAKIGYTEALAQTVSAIDPLESVVVPLLECTGHVAAEQILAQVDSPSVNASMRDGFAVRSDDVAGASLEHPIRLRVMGFAAAGQEHHTAVKAGTAVRVLTGAHLPEGADAVVSEEQTHIAGDTAIFSCAVATRKNVLGRGTDVRIGQVMVRPGEPLGPGRVGLLAAAGCDKLAVYRIPKVCLLATGNEVVLPGRPLRKGQLYASNLATLAAWCRRFHMETALRSVPDKETIIRDAVREGVDGCDAVITSGGAWTSDRDLMARVLDDLGWQKSYHRIRLGPGKAVGFGKLSGKPVFILPGGPPSNLVAFLELALPGLMRLSGMKDPQLPRFHVRIGEPVFGQKGWTDAVYGRLADSDGEMTFFPLRESSRLREMAVAEALLLIPEDTVGMARGDRRWVHSLL